MVADFEAISVIIMIMMTCIEIERKSIVLAIGLIFSELLGTDQCVVKHAYLMNGAIAVDWMTTKATYHDHQLVDLRRRLSQPRPQPLLYQPLMLKFDVKNLVACDQVWLVSMA